MVGPELQGKRRSPLWLLLWWTRSRIEGERLYSCKNRAIILLTLIFAAAQAICHCMRSVE